MVETTIRRIDSWLASNRPEYYGFLQPGVSPEVLTAFELRFSIKLPKTFRELYRWRNGQSSRCLKSLQHNRMFQSLDDIADTKDTFDGMIGFDFDDPRWWRRSDHLCVDLAAEDGGTPGQLIEFWHEEADRPVTYPNREAWLAGLAASMEDGTLVLA